MLIRVLALTLLAVTAAGPACAYIDPGSGSFIIQMLFGLVAGAAVLVRDVRLWFASLFLLTDFGSQPSALMPDTQGVAMAGLLVGYEAERLPEPKTGRRGVQCDDIDLAESVFQQRPCDDATDA